jgi:hypothetical protein
LLLQFDYLEACPVELDEEPANDNQEQQRYGIVETAKADDRGFDIHFLEDEGNMDEESRNESSVGSCMKL